MLVARSARRRRLALGPALAVGALVGSSALPSGSGLPLPGTAGSLGLGVQTARARPWTATYDWQGAPTTGAENWVADESVPATGLPGPWYRTWLGTGAPATIGRGLAVQPIGGRVFDNGDPTTQTGGPGTILRWTAPGASTVTAATFSQLRYRNEGDDQYLRLRVFGPTPGSDVRRDVGPAYGQADPATTYSPPTVTLNPPGGGTTAEAWLFTVCGPDPTTPSGSGVYRCPTVPTGTGTFGRVGTTTITLDDPDPPTLDVTPQPAITDGWTNQRRAQKFQITAADPSSGIQRILAQLKLGTTTRTLADRTVTCDPSHKTPGRGGLVCPPTATTTATDPGRDSSTRDRTYVVTTFDYAGNTTVKTFVVRRDLQKPTAGTLGGLLRQVARRPSGLKGIVAATVRAADSQSGVARIEVLTQRRLGGRTTVIGTTDIDCTRGCKTVSPSLDTNLSLLPADGSHTLRVRVTDRAGNQRTFGAGKLQLDWKAPQPPKARVVLDPNGSATAIIDREGRDPAESSGRGDYYIVYPSRTAGDDSVIRRDDGEVRALVAQSRAQIDGPARAVRSKSRRVRLPGYEQRNEDQPGFVFQTDYVDPVSPRAKLRGARGRAPLPCPATLGGPPSRYATQQAFWQFISYWAARTSATKKPTTIIIIRHGLDLSLSRRTLTLRLTSARTCGPPYREFSSAKILDSHGRQRGKVVDFRGNPDVSRTIRHTRALPGGRYRVVFRTIVSYGDGGKYGPAPSSAWIRCGVDPEERSRCTFELGQKPSVLRCALPTSGYHKNSDRERRWNLCVKSGRLPGVTVTTGSGLQRKVNYSPEIAEAHHIFPREFRRRFRAAEIDIDAPSYLCWMRFSQHRTRVAAYSRIWGAFLKKRPTRSQILEYGRQLTRSGPDSCVRQYR